MSTFDRTHNLVIRPAVSTPFGRGRRFRKGGGVAASPLGGWRLNGVFIAGSGAPVSISGVSLAANTAINNTNRPDQTGLARIPGGMGPGQSYFDTTVFAGPAPGRWGSAGRNTLRALVT